jgi:hypothetical protein
MASAVQRRMHPMSWGVRAQGKPHAVQVAVAEQFARCRENCKANEREVATINNVEAVVNEELAHAADTGIAAVSITADGSCYNNTNNVSVKVDTLPFLE